MEEHGIPRGRPWKSMGLLRKCWKCSVQHFPRPRAAQSYQGFWSLASLGVTASDADALDMRKRGDPACVFFNKWSGVGCGITALGDLYAVAR